MAIELNNLNTFVAWSTRSSSLLPTPQSANVGSDRALDRRDAVALRHIVKGCSAVEAAQEYLHLRVAPHRGVPAEVILG